MIRARFDCPGCGADNVFLPLEAAIYREPLEFMKQASAEEAGNGPAGEPPELYGYILSRCHQCGGDVFIHFNIYRHVFLDLMAEHFPEAYRRNEDVDDLALFTELEGDLSEFVIRSSLAIDRLEL